MSVCICECEGIGTCLPEYTHIYTFVCKYTEKCVCVFRQIVPKKSLIPRFTCLPQETAESAISLHKSYPYHLCRFGGIGGQVDSSWIEEFHLLLLTESCHRFSLL